jgi:hypothetical protein
MTLFNSAYSACANLSANVEGDGHGIWKGRFFWPLNFDPVWLIKCDGYEEGEKSKLPHNREVGSGIVSSCVPEL